MDKILLFKSGISTLCLYLGLTKCLVTFIDKVEDLKENKYSAEADCFEFTFFMFGGLIPVLGDKEFNASNDWKR